MATLTQTKTYSVILHSAQTFHEYVSDALGWMGQKEVEEVTVTAPENLNWANWLTEFNRNSNACAIDDGGNLVKIVWVIMDILDMEILMAEPAEF